MEAPREGIDTVRDPAGRNNGPCNLLIDADDTLWENNILFERVITQVQALLRTFNVDAHIFRQQLDEAELEHIPVYGYGTVRWMDSRPARSGNSNVAQIGPPALIRHEIVP